MQELEKDLSFVVC